MTCERVGSFLTNTLRCGLLAKISSYRKKEKEKEKLDYRLCIKKVSNAEVNIIIESRDVMCFI